MEAARRAGCRVVARRCGGWDDASLARADEIYDGPRALLQQLARSLSTTGIAAPRGT